VQLHQRIIAFDLVRLAAGRARWIFVEKSPRERPSAS
jgi:hypothetical protein